MKLFNKKGFAGDLRSDIPSAIVVFLVALPLCLGIALASGAPLFSGIIAGIVGGMVVTLFSGSPLGVSGPAAGLAVIVLSSIQQLGEFEIFLLAVVVAGVFQIILGFLKAGVIGYYFPSSVIRGMLSGIGVLIILKQIPHAFGYDKNPEGQTAFVQPDGENTFSELINLTNHISAGPLLIALFSVAVLILWEKPFIKRITALKAIPGPLIAVVGGILLNSFFSKFQALALSGDQLVSIPVASSFSGFLDQFTLPDFSQLMNPNVYLTGITIAVIASIETLLCVEATDKLDPQKRVTPTNRELTAQGIGNILSGMIGGLPITQVIVRSSANIQSGGKTKTSAFIHGVLLLVCAISIPGLLNMIPLASLAAILILVGFKLASPALFREIYKKGKSQFIPFAVTIVGIVLTDLLTGIGLGMAVAIFQILRNNYKTPYHFNPSTYDENKPVVIHLSEDVSFLNKAGIQRTLNELPDNSTVIIDASHTRSIHPDVIEIIEDFQKNAETRQIRVQVKGLHNVDMPDPIQDLRQKIHKKQKPSKRRFKVSSIFNN